MTAPVKNSGKPRDLFKDSSRALNVVPIWAPMSIFDMAPLGITLTAAPPLYLLAEDLEYGHRSRMWTMQWC